MSDHEFSNKKELDLVREYTRRHLPGGDEGCVIEDVDLVMRLYGPNYGLGGMGKFALVELKHNDVNIEFAQKRTFGMIDTILRRGDTGNQYVGYFKVGCEYEDWEIPQRFWVNGILVSREELLAFLQFDPTIIKHVTKLGDNQLEKTNGDCRASLVQRTKEFIANLEHKETAPKKQTDFPF